MSGAEDVTGARAPGRGARAVAATSVAIAGVWLLMSLSYPFGWDQGLFAWMGAVIVDGGLPYRDAWDFKGPLVYYAYAWAEQVFGVHLWSIRIFDAALLIWASVSLSRLVSTLTDTLVARWAALVFFLWYASHSYWHTAQPDGWTGMLLVIATAPLVSTTTPSRRLVVLFAGFCVGVTTLFKPLNAIWLLMPLLYLIASPSSRKLRVCTWTVAGFALPVLLAASWFSAHGALDALIEVHLKYAALYVWLSPDDTLRGLVDYFLINRVVAVAMPIVLYGVLVLWRSQRPAAIALVSWLALAIISVTAQGRFYAYHWMPFLPAATALGAVGLHDIRARLPVLARVMVGVILVHCVAPIALEEVRFVSWIAGLMSRDAYYDAYGEPGSDMRAVRWLREQGQPGKVYVFGWHSSVAWLSERETVSRFGYSLPLMLGDQLEIRSRYRAELLEALRATPPRYILVGAQSQRIIGRAMTIDDFPEFASLVRNGYRAVAHFDTLTIHEMNR